MRKAERSFEAFIFFQIIETVSLSLTTFLLLHILHNFITYYTENYYLIYIHICLNLTRIEIVTRIFGIFMEKYFLKGLIFFIIRLKYPYIEEIAICGIIFA